MVIINPNVQIILDELTPHPTENRVFVKIMKWALYLVKK